MFPCQLWHVTGSKPDLIARVEIYTILGSLNTGKSIDQNQGYREALAHREATGNRFLVGTYIPIHTQYPLILMH